MTNKQYSQKFFVLWIANAILCLCSLTALITRRVDGLTLLLICFVVTFANNTYWFYKLEKYFANKANLLINS